MTAPYHCRGCTARWSGYSLAHCASCHCTFTGVSNFDDHRRDGACLQPQSIGLSATVRHGWPVWGRVMDDDTRARFTARRQP